MAIDITSCERFISLLLSGLSDAVLKISLRTEFSCWERLLATDSGIGEYISISSSMLKEKSTLNTRFYNATTVGKCLKAIRKISLLI